MRRAFVATFGCKLNQCESQAISEKLASKGFVLCAAPGRADVVIINTCSVTGQSDRQARQAIRSLHRSAPGACLVVTGCYAERAPHEISSLPGVALVAGNAEKAHLHETIGSLEAGAATLPPTRSSSGRESPARARALVKIQDGCDSACTYCVVPQVRGASRSVSRPAILGEISSLRRRGFREIVLTGARIGCYGREEGRKGGLVNLLQEILRGVPDVRLRLSSLEPGEVADSLLELVRGERRMCRHFHVPLQSGSDAVLRAMGRPYSAGEYAERIGKIHSRLPDACVGTDVIAGFPGETDVDFDKTVRLIERLPVSYLHVFPFSERPGTPAGAMGPVVERSCRKQRAAELRALGERKRTRFVESQIGSVQEAIVEGPAGPGLFKATTGNYLRLLVRGASLLPRQMIEVQIKDTADGRVCAELR
ncbi:MAG: tRNA (N(6)-L-threonylcarbamoyladenosine(37)-C(2))-methylthiotransferase MtaB [Candidatus Eisenbacteria bacterium]